MAEEYITKEQFKLYQEIQDREKQHKANQSLNNTVKPLAILVGLGALVGTSTIVHELSLENMRYGLTVFTGIFTIFNGALCYLDINLIKGNLSNMGRLEREIEDLESQPAYQSLLA